MGCGVECSETGTSFFFFFRDFFLTLKLMLWVQTPHTTSSYLCKKQCQTIAVILGTGIKTKREQWSSHNLLLTITPMPVWPYGTEEKNTSGEYVNMK